MLLKDFYESAIPEDKGENTYQIRVTLNPDHKIYSGHFPDNPVVPGVCIVQILKELTSSILGRDLTLVKAGNIKFLLVVNPVINKTVDFTISLKSEEELTVVKASASFNDTICFKFGGRFK